MSIALLLAAIQGLLLALLLWRTPVNRAANRWLALLIVAVVLLITPFIIGYAGFYDRWPRLSFAPFSWTLAFGPLIWLYTVTLTGKAPRRVGLHFVPVLVQVLADAVVFPLPLATKNWWDTVANAPYISPALEQLTLVSIAAYGWAAWRCYRGYRDWLSENRTDGVDFEPDWIGRFLLALGAVALVWAGFQLANRLDPTRDYFDQFWLYMSFSGLVLYLGIEGWRHAGTRFPEAVPPPAAEVLARVPKDWAATGATWLHRIDTEALWRDPGLTLASLARQLGTNTAYLSRALNAAEGANFNAIVNRRRVQFVQARLAAGERGDLLAMAFEAGFSSKASFNRAFQEFAGMSPSAWRLKTQKAAAA
jgi:AraC-like DNA-binding protein